MRPLVLPEINVINVFRLTKWSIIITRHKIYYKEPTKKGLRANIAERSPKDLLHHKIQLGVRQNA